MWKKSHGNEVVQIGQVMYGAEELRESRGLSSQGGVHMRRAMALLVSAIIGGATFFTISSSAHAAPLTDVGVAVTSLPATISVNQDVIYRVKASNNGATPAVAVTVTDTVTGAAFDAAHPTPGYSISGSTATCSLTTLAPGQSVVYDLFAKGPSTAGSITDNAHIS